MSRPSVSPCYAVAVGSLSRGNGDGGKQMTKGEVAIKVHVAKLL